jgi:hypothetical protein
MLKLPSPFGGKSWGWGPVTPLGLIDAQPFERIGLVEPFKHQSIKPSK